MAATGLLIRKEKAVNAGAGALRNALEDASASVRVAAAEALGRYGADGDRGRAVKVPLALAAPAGNGPYVATLAWNALDQLPVEVLRAVRAEIEATDVGPPTGFAAPRPAGGARPGDPRVAAVLQFPDPRRGRTTWAVAGVEWKARWRVTQAARRI